MPIPTSRIPFTPQNPYRKNRPATSKIMFISVAEDAVRTREKYRTKEHISLLGKNRPKQLVDKINTFKKEKNNIYEFEKYPEDEFWIVTDVDNNLSAEWIKEWNEALDICAQNGYRYAISNPFFEIWLLLHHDDANMDDKKWAVTDEHAYEPTNHFRERLRALGVPLKDQKHISKKDYTKEKIQDAIQRAAALHIQNSDKYPKYFATTVYLLLQKIIEML